jgi:uncharacterized protein YndB with AHSA1/START domain
MADMSTTDDGAPEPGDPSPDAPIPTEGSAPTTSEVIPAAPDDVFAVLVDAACFPEWLVGARRIRDIDPSWPAVGSTFRHRIGWGPLQLPGSTSVRRCRRPHELVLAAGMGPLGEASVRFELVPVADGTLVRLEELPARGVVRAAWRMAAPLVTVGLWGRNAVSLGELGRVVRARASG